MKYFKHVSAFLVLGLLVFGSLTAFSAITTIWDFSDPADYDLSDEDDVTVVGNQLLIDNIKEFQVNDFVGGGQGTVMIDTTADGNFVLVWESNDNAGTADNDESYVALKIIDAEGSDVLSEILVNDEYEGKQFTPVVEVLDNGNIFVAWHSQDLSFGTDNSQSKISAKILDNTGGTVVSEFQVNDEITGIQSSPSVTELSNGNIVVTWSSADTVLDPGVGNDNSGGYVAGKILDNTGGTVVSEFQVNDEITGIQGGSDVLGLNNGNFVVLWYSTDLSNPFTDTSVNYTAAKLYDEDGVVLLPEFQVNDETENEQWNVSALQLDNGNILITWSSNDSNNSFTDNSSYYIAAKVYDEDLVEIIAETQINQEIESIQRFSTLENLSNGDVIVTWSSFDTNHVGDDNDTFHIAGIVIDDQLEVVKDEFQINDGIISFQTGSVPAVSQLNGNVLVGFASFDYTYSVDDNDFFVLLGKIYQPDMEEFYPETSPFVSLVDGVAYNEALRTFSVDEADDSQGSVSLQISNDDGATWYYYDGADWVTTVDGVAESNTVAEVNDNLFEFFETYGDGVFNWKIFLNSDGTELVIVDSVSLSENEIPVIGNGDAEVSIDVPQNRENVAQFTATDPEDDELVYSISGGADAGLFSITNGGLLSISLDGDLGETYEVVVRSTDEFDGFTEQTVNVTVVRVPPSNGSASSGGSSSSPFAGNTSSNVGDGSSEIDEGADISEGVGSEYENKNRETQSTLKGDYCIPAFEEGLVGLTNGLQRLEAVKLLLDFMCVDVTDSNYIKDFIDTKELPELDRMYLNKAFELRLIKGYPDGNFRPKRILNFAELSALLYRSNEMDMLDSIPWYVDYIRVVGVVDDSRLGENVSVSEFVEKVEAFFGF